MRGQTNFLDEIIVDSFAGGGGASTGIELALGRPVDIAINHDITAIRMHEINHPFTKHYCENIFEVDPKKATQGRPVGLLWASPDCTHFSRAKGGKPVKKEIRGLAWVVVRWTAAVRPRVIILENVPEFQTWGPLDKNGRPKKEKSGKTFRQFVGHLRNLSYNVDWRVLSADDYGAGTSRKRLYLIARSDGRAIVWPKPTHGDAPGLKPKHVAAEYIDFSIRGKSIFNRKKPLAEATLKRIAKGLDKFTIKSKKPFLIKVNHSGDFMGRGTDEIMPTLLGKGNQSLAEPKLSPYMMCNNNNNIGSGAEYPIHTTTSGNRYYAVAPHIQKYFGGNYQGSGSDVNAPLDTVTAIDHNANCSAEMMPFISSKYGDNGAGNVRGREAEKPLPTTAAMTVHSSLLASNLIQYHAETNNKEVRAYGIDEAVKVIDTSPRYGLVSANLINYYSTGTALDIDKPNPTQTTKDRMAVVENHLCVLRNNMDCKAIDQPLSTATTSPGHFAHIKTYLIEYAVDAELRNWPHVRELLNKYADYAIAANEVLIIEIDGVPYFIGDIEMRMLRPRELYGCQGFPPDYVIDYVIENGKRKTLPIHEQVKKVGNSVCPPIACILVKCNLPDFAYKGNLATMQELNKAIAS